MTKQRPVFFQFHIIPDQVEELTSLLNKGGNPAKKDGFFSFEKIKNVHFARWFVIPATEGYPASLIYSSNIDGAISSHLADLVNILTDDLDQILSYCTDYPAENGRNKDTRLAYLKQHSISTPGFYAGAPNRTVEQIHNEAKLYDAVRDFVKENNKKWSTKHEAYEAIKKFLADDPQWDWAKKKYHLPKVRVLKMLLFVLLIICILPLFIIFLILIHFLYEKRAKPFGITVNQIPLEDLAKLKVQEDIVYQNQLSQIFEMKGGLRKLGLKFFLAATNFAAANFFVKGQLMGTPTIHFARWVIIDKGKRFVFFSNFDGSFDEYLGDFVDNNGWGLNAIYGASKGYPRTFFMFGGGSYKILEFMGWGRKTQVPTQIWYSAYPWYGLQQIIDKSKLRVALFNKEELSNKEIDEMLRRI